jgi:alpha-glucosidase
MRTAAGSLAVALLALFAASDKGISIASPDKRITLVVSGLDGALGYSARLSDQRAIEPSPLGLIVDGSNLVQGATIDGVDRYQIRETYPWRGVHAEAVNRANGARITLAGQARAGRYTLDVRAFDDGVAFRLVVPGTGRRVPDAGSAFRFPAGSLVWSHDLVGHYEGLYRRQRIEDVKDGEWAGPPITVKLPNGHGYVAVTEAALANYAGMVLQADGRSGFRERLGHAAPPSHPYTLRYGDEEAARLSAPAAIDGTITTPWRVVMIAPDLNRLVNSDAVANLSPPPDPQFFPEGMRTSWVRPGRAVWRYLDGGENTLEGIKEFSRLAGELGFEYQVVEGLWQRWTDAELRDLVEYSRARHVGIIVWRHSNTLHDAAARRRVFASLRDAGVVGMKIDFFDHEAKEVIDLYQAILRDAAEFHLLLDFHGANKPAGEARTWPNEMTREGIYGLEHRTVPAWAEFNTTFPFARLLAGHADYTPVVFGDRRKETSWAHQIASAAILTSPLLVYGAHPASILANPAVEIIRTIPSVWDETRVLAPSEIGELALVARRRGDRWFVAAMNGPVARAVTVPLAFLPKGAHELVLAKDNASEAASVDVERRDVSAGDSLTIAMRAAGGFVARLSKK